LFPFALGRRCGCRAIAVGAQAQVRHPPHDRPGCSRRGCRQDAGRPPGLPGRLGQQHGDASPAPKQWEDKKTLTDAEIANLQKFARAITENDGDAQFGDGFILAVLNQIEKPTSYDPAPATTTSSGSSSATGTIAGPRSSSIRRTASFRR
jgi:hypothetical protein